MYKKIIAIGLLSFTLGSSLRAQTVEDQTGAAYPSDHEFLDRLDYSYPGAGFPVPQLSSAPGASGAIYLDFNGGYVVRDLGTFSISCFVKAPGVESLDANDAEAIFDVFAQVAESFRSFDVNVTTKLADFLSVPETHRTWLFFTSDSSGGWGGGFGQDSRPALAHWPNGLLAVHELGHNYGNRHYGIPGGGSFDYYYGHVSGILDFPRWNTFMGYFYVGDMLQWTKGEYYNSHAAGSSALPDNLANIAARSPYRADDHGDSASFATVLSSDSEKRGVIEQTTDTDYFSFTSGPGTITIDVLSLATHPELPLIGSYYGVAHPALDLSIKLFDSSGEVAASNPSAELDAQLTFEAPVEDTYYLSIEGTGLGDPLNNPANGYTEYGSLGSYSVSASFSTAFVPDLRVSSFQTQLWNPHPGDPAYAHIKHLRYFGQVKNFGGAPVGTLGRLQMYKHHEPDLSDPGAPAPAFEDLAHAPSYWVSVHAEGMGIYTDVDGRQAGEFDETLVIDTELLPEGIYYLYAYCDDPNTPGGDAVEESDETNNVMVLDLDPDTPGAQGYVLDRSGG
ncbi:MAG: hypothetical protein GY719_36915 [bacterium]|nr:hypothetical protein [bacterium]